MKSFFSIRTAITKLSNCPVQVILWIGGKTNLEGRILQIRLIVESSALPIDHVCACCNRYGSMTITAPEQGPQAQYAKYLDCDASQHHSDSEFIPGCLPTEEEEWSDEIAQTVAEPARRRDNVIAPDDNRPGPSTNFSIGSKISPQRPNIIKTPV